jgi:hypothetical protein
MPKRDALERARRQRFLEGKSMQLRLLLAGAVTDIRDLLQLPTIEGLALEDWGQLPTIAPTDPRGLRRA